MIEVTIVVLIIGLLAAIALPNYQLFTARAKRTEAIATLRAVDLGEHVYLNNYDTFKRFPNNNSTTVKKVFADLEIGDMSLKNYKIYGPVIFGCSVVAGGPIVSYCMGLVGNIDNDFTPDVLAIQATRQGCNTPCTNLGPSREVLIYSDDLNH